MTFSTKLSALLLMILVAGISSIGYLGYRATTGMLENDVRDHLENHAFHIMDKIDRMFFERYADMRMLAADPVVKSRDSAPVRILKRLKAYQAHYKHFSTLAFFNIQRRRLADTSGYNIGIRHSTTEYWPDIASGRDFVMTIAESQALKHVVIYFAAVVKDARGRPFGLVAASMPVESLYEIAEQNFRSRKDQKTFKVELWNREGLVLYSSYDAQRMLKEKSQDWQSLTGLLAQGKNVGSVRHGFLGEDEITAFAREQGYRGFKGNGWILVICTPTNVAFAPAYALGMRLLIIFFCIGVAVLLSTFVISRAAVKPIKELSAAAAEIGRGHLEIAVPVRSRDEIGSLARAFNEMTRDLKESENKFRDLAELLPQIIYETDRQGNITFANRHARELFGYAQNDIAQGLNFLDVFSPEDRQRAMDNMAKALAGEKIDNAEYAALRKDGTVFPLLTFAVPITSNGKVLGIRGIGIDITERKEAEKEIRKFESLVENSLDFIGIASLDGGLLYLNPAARLLVGLGRDEKISNKKIPDFFFDEDIPRLLGKMAGTDFWRGEFRLRHFITRASIPVEMTGFTIRDMETGRPLALATVNRDITERKRREKELMEGGEKLRRITDTARDAIVMMDDQGCISFWNPAAENIFGYRSDEIRGKELHACLSPARYYGAYKKGFELFRQTGEGAAVGRTLELDAIRKGGTEFKVELSLSSIYINETWHAVGVMRDITERKQVEETIKKMNEELERKVRERTKQLLDAQDELVRREKLATLGQVAGTVGHELRNPLGVMNNAVYFLQTVLADANDTVKEYLGIIKSEIAGAERIVSDLLDAVRTKPPRPQLVSAEEVLRASLETCRMPEDITVDVRTGTKRPVSVDPLQMKQVFINLINNAVDAMPRGGSLKISVGEDRDTIKISFEDEGAGIAPEIQARIFQPLFTTKARGIGLGLVVVKNLTEANGGSIGVESTVGKGTIVTILLPAGRA